MIHKLARLSRPSPRPNSEDASAGRGSRPGTVLVTDAGRGSAVAIIRSLGRAGYRVIPGDADRRSLGFHSRYAHAPLVYPSPAEAPTAFVAAVLHAVRERGIDLIIPVTDEAILPLSEARSALPGACRLALPEAESLAIASDKHTTWELARTLGVAAPQTHLAHSLEEAIEAADRLGWPVVLKPQASRRLEAGGAVSAFRVAYANGRADLEQEMRRFQGRCAVLVQEYTPGLGVGVEMLLYEGRPLAAFQHRRLRELPVTGGVSTLRESAPLDPQMHESAAKLLDALNWTGLAMVEFKIGPRGPKLMEINGRVWGSLPLAIHSGMDFPAKLVKLYLEDSRPDGSAGPDIAYRSGVRSRNLELDLVWIASVLVGRRPFPFLPAPPRRKALAAVLGLLDPRTRHDILSLWDPLPGLAEFPKIARRCLRKLQRARRCTLEDDLAGGLEPRGRDIECRPGQNRDVAIEQPYR